MKHLNIFKKSLFLGILMQAWTLQATLTEAYGIVKPTREMPAAGILHFKENEGLELQGYLSRIESNHSIEVAVWTMDGVDAKPYCVGPQCEKKELNAQFPIRHLKDLGHVIPDKNGYGELSIKIGGVSLEELRKPTVKVIVYLKGEKEKYYSENLIDQKYSTVELRWIED